MRAQPIAFEWLNVRVRNKDDVEFYVRAMVPVAGRYARAADRQFGEVGTEHVLTPYEERNMKFHQKCFAALHEAWINLPEKVAARWPHGEEHFRKWLLCNHSSFYDETEHDVPTREEALALATGVRAGSPYASIYGPRKTASGWKIVVRRPRSQQVAKMSPRDFEESMMQILDAAGEFVGVPRGALIKNAGRAA